MHYSLPHSHIPRPSGEFIAVCSSSSKIDGNEVLEHTHTADLFGWQIFHSIFARNFSLLLLSLFMNCVRWNAESACTQTKKIILILAGCERVHSPVVNGGTPVSLAIGGVSARANEINPTVLSSMNAAANECTVKCHNESRCCVCFCCWCGRFCWRLHSCRCDANASLLLRSHCRRRSVVAMEADVMEDTTIFAPTVAAA